MCASTLWLPRKFAIKCYESGGMYIWLPFLYNLFLIDFEERCFHTSWRCLKPIAAYFKIQHYNSVFVIICYSIYFLLFEKEIFWTIFKWQINFFQKNDACNLGHFLDSVMLCSFHSPWNISGLHCLWTWEYVSFAVPSWEQYPREARGLAVWFPLYYLL